MATGKSSTMTSLTKSLRDMDANTLFENHTVEEVREIEKKVRNDIEWKKEEMRDLVGERYRDLISAADTIKQMKVCAESVGDKLTAINVQCQKLRHIKTEKGDAGMASRVVSSSTTDQRAVYEIACEIKLLLAVPGKIWSYLDSADYLPAAKLYLLSKHVHSCLQYDTQTGGQVVGRFPVIAKQWAAISHFKSAILQGCRRVLADYTESSSHIADAACSILLLEDKTPRQVFQDFLIARMYTGKGLSGVRSHIQSAVNLIHNTVYQLTAVFCNGQPEQLGESNLLAITLSKLLQKPLLEQLGISEFSSLNRHLPKSVTGYQPNLRVQNVSLSEEYLKSSCDKWIESCLDNVRGSVKEQLGYVTTVKSMNSLKLLIFDIYTQDERMKFWPDVCSGLFSSSINMWLSELSPLFISRVQEIISEHLNSILSATETQLNASKELILSQQDANRDSSKVIKEIDMSAFIWCESANDLPTMESWVTSAQKTFQDGGGLLMKAHGFTPIVQNLCNRLNQSLGALLSEIETYKQIQEVSADVQQLLSNQQSLSTRTAEYMSEESYQLVSRLSEMVKKELELNKKENGPGDVELHHCRWVLLAARFCSAVPKLCPQLEKCMHLQTANDQMENTMSKSMTMSMSRSYSKQISVSPLWTSTTEILNDTSRSCYRVWIAHTVESIGEEFRAHMSMDDITGVLRNVTRWDDVEIQEDAEDGKTVKSVISVPMQITWCLQRTLNQLCKYINSVGSHSIARDLQVDLVSDVLLTILNVYKTNIDNDERLTQAVALQYLFDIWYLSGLLLWRDSSKATHIDSLINSLTRSLQAKVDPFDFDVFAPHMQKHVAKQRSRNLVLFGAIADVEKVLSTASRQTNAAKSEQHNVLPFYSVSNARFPLLPVISDTARTNPQAIAGKASKQMSASSRKEGNPALSKIQSEPVMKMSSSFYDRIGSGAMSWFTGGTTANK